MNTITTRKICQLTPMAALAVNPSSCPTNTWSITPCRPATRFCSIVGHASFQTAGLMGPSMRERSNGEAFFAGGGTDI